MIRLLGSLILFFVFALSAEANYLLHADGYYYYNGGSQAYTRTQTYGYVNGCYCLTYAYTPYVYAQPAVPYVAPVTSATPDWRNKILDIAAAGKEQQYFMDAITATGLRVSPSIVTQQSYSSQSYGGYQQQFFAPQASTTYAHTQQDRAIFYGDTDMMALYQMNNRQIENLSKVLGTSQEGFQALVNQAAQNARDTGADQARRLEIIAKAQALQIALDAARRSIDEKKTVIESKSTDFKTVPNVPQAPNTIPQAAPTGLDALGALFQRDCAMCHSSSKKEGGLDLQDWQSFDSAKKQGIWVRVTTNDEKKAMPRTKEGGVGHRWTSEEAKLLLTN